VLRPGGPALFTDPLTVTGLIRREEMVVRSCSRGEQVFTPPGLDELEGAEPRASYDRYLCAVELLAAERRLTRLAHIGSKPA